MGAPPSSGGTSVLRFIIFGGNGLCTKNRTTVEHFLSYSLFDVRMYSIGSIRFIFYCKD